MARAPGRPRSRRPHRAVAQARAATAARARPRVAGPRAAATARACARTARAARARTMSCRSGGRSRRLRCGGFSLRWRAQRRSVSPGAEATALAAAGSRSGSGSAPRAGPGSRSTARASSRVPPGDEPISIGARERCQPEAKLVGAMPAELALVAVLELLATRATLTGLLDALLQLFGLVASAAPAAARPPASISSSSSSTIAADGRAVAVELLRDVVPGLPPRREPAVVDEQASAVEVASRCRGSEPRGRRLGSFGVERRLDEREPAPDRSRCARSARRS